MLKFETVTDFVTVYAPAYWAPALINGDYSYLTEKEEKEVEEWAARQAAAYGQAYCLITGLESEGVYCDDPSTLIEYTMLTQRQVEIPTGDTFAAFFADGGDALSLARAFTASNTWQQLFAVLRFYRSSNGTGKELASALEGRHFERFALAAHGHNEPARDVAFSALRTAAWDYLDSLPVEGGVRS